MNKNIKLPEGLTEAQYNSWKEKWPSLVELLEVPSNNDGSETIQVVIKSIEQDRTVCGQYELHSDRNPDKAREILVVNGVLFGKETVLNNNYAFRSVSQYLLRKIPFAEAKLLD